MQHTRRTVLIVDDCADSCESLGMILELEGFKVRTANTGQSALDALDALGVDTPLMILLDISLPDIDGLEVARRVRQRPNGDRYRLIGVSGHGSPDDRVAATTAGMDGYLVKPVEPQTVIDLLCRQGD